MTEHIDQALDLANDSDEPWHMLTDWKLWAGATVALAVTWAIFTVVILLAGGGAA